MDYKKLIKQAVEKRETSKRLQEQKETLVVQDYIKQIKALKPRIKTLLGVEKLLLESGFDYNELCTDSWSHKLGFAQGKNALGVYGGGACGEYNLVVDDLADVLMTSGKDTRVPNYTDVWFLKRFVTDFDEFEFRIEQFVKNL